MIQKSKDIEVLLTAIDILPEDTAHVLRLHYLEKRSLKEISGMIGKSISTVRNHQGRGLFLLHRHFIKKPR
jgi:RNA polymerase sigma factor (sigma-70 family)